MKSLILEIRKMKKFIGIIILQIIIGVFSAPAQSIKGVILDTANNPIEAASISINENAISTITNQSGVFELKKIGKGNNTITISHIGYANKTILINAKYEEVINLKIKLDKTNFIFENIIVKGNKFNTYSKIAGIDLILRPLNSAQDALRIVPSLFIAQHAGGGKAEQIFLRGFDIDHGTDINITVDGIPVNMLSHAHGQGYADLHFLIPETIHNVNFDKGPYNAEKGNLATAGYVEFKTKDFLENNSIKLETGKFNMQRITGLVKLFSAQKENNKQQLYIAGEYNKNDGYFESSQNFNRFNILTKYRLLKNNDTKLNILFSTFSSNWNASGQIPERAVKSGLIENFGSIDNREGGKTSRTNASVQFTKNVGKGYELQQQAFFTNYNFNLFSNFTFFLNNPLDGDMINQQEKRNIYGYTSKIKKQYFIHNKKVSSTVGVGFRYDDVKEISLSNTPNRVFTSDVKRGSIKELNSFAFVNNNIDLSKKLSVNASLRYDYFKFGYKNITLNERNFKYQQKATFSPKLNFNYSLHKNINLFVSNGIGFHSNDTRVILDNQATSILPKVVGTDIGISTKPTKNLIVKTIFWHLYSEQEFVYVGDAGIVELSGASKRIGADIIMRYQINKWLYSDVDISIAKARTINAKKGEDYIPLAPLFTSVGGLSAKINNRLNASVRYRFMDNRPATQDYTVTAKGYFLMDALLEYKYKKINFLLSAENIFNSNWKEAQFNTESRLKDEAAPVSEIHFTPGSPFFIKTRISFQF